MHLSSVYRQLSARADDKVLYSPGNMDTGFLTAPQASKELGYSLQHTRLLIRKGRLKAIKLGRDWVILRAALDEFRKCYFPSQN